MYTKCNGVCSAQLSPTTAMKMVQVSQPIAIVRRLKEHLDSLLLNATKNS